MRTDQYKCDSCGGLIDNKEPVFAELCGTLANGLRRHFCSCPCLVEWVALHNGKQTDGLASATLTIEGYGTGDRLSTDI